MRRMTKITALMLLLTCAMTMVPQTAEASLWGQLIDLTYSEPIPKPLYVWNNTGRPVRIRVWTNYGEYAKFRYNNGGVIGVQSDATWFAVEAAVWNKNTKKYVVMDDAECPRYTDFEFYKHARGDFRLRVWC